MRWPLWGKDKKGAESNILSPPPAQGWQWSAYPGGFERHLQRRWNNPLFSKARRTVTAQEFYMARSRDEELLRPLVIEVEALQRSWPAELPIDFLNWCHDTRASIEALLDKYYPLGGNKQIHDTLLRKYQIVIETWKAGLKDSPKALASLNEAEDRRKGFSYLENTFVHQIVSPSPYIPDDEAIPSLLSEPVETIRQFCKFRTANQSQERAQEIIATLRQVSIETIKAAMIDTAVGDEILSEWNEKLEAIH